MSLLPKKKGESNLNTQTQRRHTDGHVRMEAQVGMLPRWLSGKESACNAEIWVRSLGQEDPLEEGMVAHSSILAWRIPWTEEPSGLYSRGSQSQT